ncbi:MAG: phosphoglycerate dehydrogenase [Planctomycetota bacterium]
MSQSPRVLVCDDLHPLALEELRSRGLVPEVRTGMDEATLVEAARDAEALVVRSATKVTRPVLEAARALRVVGRAGIGVDNVDCAAATERGVVVMNTPTGNATTTAEHALALMVALARHVPRADRQVRGGSWKKKGLMGTELTGKTLGVIGLGRIGRLVAERAQGLKMRVIAYDPYLLQAGGGSPAPGVELLPLNDLLPRADFLTLHVPLSDATRGLISWEELALVKPGARLINASRGGVVDEEAALDALAEGRLAGAAFDVLEQEPPAPDHPFLTRDDVILTPHLGASSSEAQERVAVDIARQIAGFLLDGVAENAVNAPALDAEAIAGLAPFLRLAEKTGSLLAQRLKEPIRKLELTVGGDIQDRDVEHLQLALLVGCLRQALDEGINFVNAPIAARERGVRVLVSREEEPTYTQGQLKVRASTKAGGESHVVKGAVFGRQPRIVRIDGVHLDLPTSGNLLLTSHEDQPGVVGLIGTVLGEHGVNIRRIELGPPLENGGGVAAGFFVLYEMPSPEVIDEIAALAPVREVDLVQL